MIVRNTITGIVLALAFAWFAGALSAQTLNLDYSTYLGGAGQDGAKGICLGLGDRPCVVGWTSSGAFPVVNAYQSSWAGDYDAYVCQYSPSGSSLIFSTFLGGVGEDTGMAICSAANGELVIAGYTESTDFPVANAYQTNQAGSNDVFISRISSSSSALIFSTYLGGQLGDIGYGVALDLEDRVYATGWAQSIDFPTLDAYQTSNAGEYDAFIARLSSSGSTLTYSTYLGGANNDEGMGIASDAEGRATLVGFSYSADFPTASAYQAIMRGGRDAFVSRLSSSGSALVYSTYLGGGDIDEAYNLSLDSQGQVLLTGYTFSSDFPLADAYQTSLAGYSDALISRLSADGSTLLFSTFFGGGQPDKGYAVSQDSGGQITLLGLSSSTDFPVKNAFQTSNAGFSDAIISRFSSDGSALIFSTYLGGSDYEYGNGLALDAANRAYVAGETFSSDFPTVNPYQASNASLWDAYVARIAFRAAPAAIIDSGDYNGDGTSDIAVFRGSSGMWSVRNLTRTYFGNSTDFLVPADYNGDDTTDIAIFRGNGGMWSVRNLSRFYLGGTNDQPVPGDYNGDGTADGGIFRESSGLWSIRNLTRIYLGSSGDTVIPGYYNDDAVKDIAIFRGSTGMWSVRNITRFYFGAATDDLVPGDYNGAGKWEGGIFRPSSGMWSIRNVTRVYLGSTNDWALPADYNGDGMDDAGIFRDSTGMWSVRNLTRVYFGGTGDIPVTR